MALTLCRGLSRIFATSNSTLSKCLSGSLTSSQVNSVSLVSAPVKGFHCSLARNNIINIQDEDDFRSRVIDNPLPVIVDFHATWCGPCKLLGPKLESVVGQHDGKVIMAKVDIDDNSELAMAFKVQAVPTVMAVKGGKVVDGFMGMKDDDQLKTFVNKVIAA